MSTGYRPPSREPKGRWARHIHARRRAEGWSQTRGFELVQKAGLGLGEKSRSAYIAIDMGDRQPTADEERALLAVYGPPPEEDERPVEEAGTPELIAALTAQTAAITSLVEELRQARAEVDPQAVAAIWAFAKQTGFLPPEDDPDDPPDAPPSPRRQRRPRLAAVRPHTPNP